MTITFSVGEKTPVHSLAIIEGWLLEAIEDLIETVAAVKAGDLSQAKATITACRDLKAALQLAMDQRGYLDTYIKQVAGAVGASELDFHSARDEIGRRLARLRDAG